MSEARDAVTEQSTEYTVVGIVNDGVELNETVSDLRELGINGEDLTVVLKRGDPDEFEPLPEGTRYIVVPDDSRGLVIPVSFTAIFTIVALLFAFTTPGLGTMVFIFFITLAGILAAAAFTSVGVDAILIEMEAPAEDSGVWNEEFEKGRVLIFANTTVRSTLRPIWEILRRRGADFYIIERRLEPQPVSGATLRWAGEEGSEEIVTEAQEA